MNTCTLGHRIAKETGPCCCFFDIPVTTTRHTSEYHCHRVMSKMPIQILIAILDILGRSSQFVGQSWDIGSRQSGQADKTIQKEVNSVHSSRLTHSVVYIVNPSDDKLLEEDTCYRSFRKDGVELCKTACRSPDPIRINCLTCSKDRGVGPLPTQEPSQSEHRSPCPKPVHRPIPPPRW